MIIQNDVQNLSTLDLSSTYSATLSAPIDANLPWASSIAGPAAVCREVCEMHAEAASSSTAGCVAFTFPRTANSTKVQPSPSSCVFYAEDAANPSMPFTIDDENVDVDMHVFELRQRGGG